MTTILETGYTWRETVFGVFDPTDWRLVEVFGSDGYTDYDGVVYPIERKYTVTGTRYDRFYDKVNTTEYTERAIVEGVYMSLEIRRDGGTYIRCTL